VLDDQLVGEKIQQSWERQCRLLDIVSMHEHSYHEFAMNLGMRANVLIAGTRENGFFVPEMMHHIGDENIEEFNDPRLWSVMDGIKDPIDASE
jgi:hypothetical protein